jgi:hypothetical protein
MVSYPGTKLRKLVNSDDEPIEDIVIRAAHELSGLGEEAIIELRLIGGENSSSVARFTVRLSHEGASLLARHVQNPAFLAITTDETFREMVDGSYSPFSARLDGKLNVRGNVELGRKVLGSLAGSADQAPLRTPEGTQGLVCPTLVDDGYDYSGQSLTIGGEFFTEGGTVVLDFNASGDENYQQVVGADQNGNFTVIQPGISCGNIPGSDFGVSVTAYDLASGLNTSRNYPTPCSELPPDSRPTGGPKSVALRRPYACVEPSLYRSNTRLRG